MANNYSLFNPAPMQAAGLLLPETPQEQNLKRQQRIAEYEQREMMRKQKEQAMMEEAKKFWQSLNPAQKVGMSPVGFPVTDLVGLAGDVQMYKENPEMRSAGNYAMSGLGLLPFVPGVASTVMKKKKPAVPQSDDYITAYHGSGSDFEKFDLGKIGTGEGMQAYGHGLYFAEAEKVGKAYKDELGSVVKYEGKPILSKNKIVGTTGDQDLDDLIIQDMGNIKKSIRDAEKKVDEAYKYGSAEEFQWWQENLEKLKIAKNKVEIEDTGKLYEAKLKATSDELLDLDKTLSKQNKAIKKKLNSVLDKQLIELNPNLSSRVLDEFQPSDTLREALEQRIILGRYNQIGIDNIEQYFDKQLGDALRVFMSEIVGPKSTSAALNSAGIKGNKYLDQFSRSDSKGATRNYVIFDDRIIDIAKKYGVAIPVAGAMLLKQDMFEEQQNAN